MTRPLRVLIACERSGVVRRVFPGLAAAMADRWSRGAMLHLSPTERQTR